MNKFQVLVVIFGFVLSVLALPAPGKKDELTDGVKQSLGSPKIDEDSFIANWHAPKELSEKFPFYLSGYDLDDRPIGIIELGKWDVRAWTKKGKQAWDDLERHAQKMIYILRSGIHAKNYTSEKNETLAITDEIGLIVDFDGLNVAQITNPKVLTFITKYLGQLETMNERVAYAYFINVNAVASALVRLLRPVLGSVFERVEVYGTRTSDWLRVIRRNLPLDQIPKKYGGNQNSKPLVYYG